MARYVKGLYLRGNVQIGTQTLGQFLQTVREERKLSLRKAAPVVGCSYVHLCRIEQGRSGVSLELLERLLDLYRVQMQLHIGKEP